MTVAGVVDRRRLGRRLTALTNASVAQVIEARGAEPIRRERGAHRVGFTGPPGAGKSSLIGELADRRLAVGRSIGIVCVDPTSPATGGSILGDRIRIDRAVDHPDLYVRSIPSRTSEDGLSDNVPDLLAALEEQPFDELWLETVGVGQASFGVRSCVDTVVVLTHPGAGDTVQAMKAGILEIGDVYVVTKGDRPGADQVADELDATLSRGPDVAWRAPVIVTSAIDGRGITELSRTLDAHRQHIAAIDTSTTRARYDVARLIHRRVTELVSELDPTGIDLATAYQKVLDRLSERNTP